MGRDERPIFIASPYNGHALFGVHGRKSGCLSKST